MGRPHPGRIWLDQGGSKWIRADLGGWRAFGVPTGGDYRGGTEQNITVYFHTLDARWVGGLWFWVLLDDSMVVLDDGMMVLGDYIMILDDSMWFWVTVWWVFGDSMVVLGAPG